MAHFGRVPMVIATVNPSLLVLLSLSSMSPYGIPSSSSAFQPLAHFLLDISWLLIFLPFFAVSTALFDATLRPYADQLALPDMLSSPSPLCTFST